MRSFRLGLLALACFALPAGAQLAQTGAGKTGTAVVYSGPGDVVSGATMWWGLRAYNAAYATGSNPAADVCDAATGATCITINILANGNFDTATAQASASCAVSCVVPKLYDQTGNANHLSNSFSASPTLVFNCVGSLPCLQSTSSTIILTGVSFTPATGVVSLSIVGNRAVGTGVFLAANENANQIGNRIRGGGANLWNLLTGASGGFTATASDAAWHAGNAVINGASSVMNIDGTETTGTVNGSTTAGQIGGFRGNTSTTWKQTEAGIWDNVAFTGTQRTNLHSNQSTYWGTP